jgi:MFS transporter, DHA3 family, macrolide efflux protein
MWKNRNFLILIAGVAVSNLGLWVGIIGNLEFLQRNVESSFLQAAIILAGFLVGIFFAPMAGRVIDRSSKKKVLVYTGGIRATAVLFMFAAIYTNSVWWMVVYTLVIGLSATFSNPAMQTLIPLIVKQSDLIAANGVFVNIGTAARIIGTALGGLMLVSMSLFSLYFITIISYILIFVATLLLKVDEEIVETSRVKHKESMLTTMKELSPVLKAAPMVINGLLLLVPAYFFLSGFNLMIIEISEMQHSSAIKGMLYTTEGICVFVGTILAKRFFGDKGTVLPLLITSFLIAIAHLSLFFADHQLMSMISFGLFGLSMGTFFPIVTTIMQTEIPKTVHGRFFSIKGMVENILFQILMLLTGLFLDTIGFKKMVISFGIISLVFVSIITFTRIFPSIKRPIKHVSVHK